MTFEVYKGAITYMSTTSIDAVPFDSIISMTRAGYKFRLDGRTVSMSYMQEWKKKLDAEAKTAKASKLDTSAASKSTPEHVETIESDEQEIDNDISVDEDVEVDLASGSLTCVVEDDVAEPVAVAAKVTEPKQKKTRATKKVKCIETGVIYNSMSEAGRALGIDPASISYAVANNKATKGYTFQIVID